MNSPIRKLPGVKKQFAHVQSKVDCKRPAIPSAAAATAKGKPIQESQCPKLKTKSPTVTGATSFKSSPPVQELAKPFRARPVPQSHYGQPFRPVLGRKSPVSIEAPKVVEVPAAEAVQDAPCQDAVEEVPDVAVEVLAAEVVEAASSVGAANVLPDEVVEVPAVAEVVEVAPVVDVEAVEEDVDAAQVIEDLPVAADVEAALSVEVAIVRPDEVGEVPAIAELVEVAPVVDVDVVVVEAVEEVVDAAQVIEHLPVAAEVVEAADEDEVVPPVVASAAEAPVPSEVVSGTEKKKRNRKKKKKAVASDALDAPPVLEAPSVQVEPRVVDPAWYATLTRKQKRNIHTNRRRSAAWKAQRELLGPDAHIYIAPGVQGEPRV